ncbi:hypothetical protein EX895_003129 [Sporisorium graminicola]|uniref:Uncharacterized protein n=1 Tax=Sporisorium graminicola TaxID=280036 RepID=A0A4U7KU47_9BASI|nr:hypothetical protein EX895_003129 [Sporisorium graminicola]TKY88033.1 hypothetical protein EX895_003129 [Sporisorium graminicola]
MASASRLGAEGAIRADAPSSRRSISSQAASASRALTSVASASISTPYAGLSSSASSSSSLSTPKRRPLASSSQNSFSRYSNPSPPTRTHTNDARAPYLARRSGSTSSAGDVHSTEPAVHSVASTSRVSSDTAPNHPSRPYDDSAVRRHRVPSRVHAERSSRNQRRRSAESLRLDLDGLDLGDRPAFGSSFDNEGSLPHLRPRSNYAKPTSTPYKPPNRNYNGVDVAPDQFCTSCASGHPSRDALNGIEDSFSLHLREECSEYREIMSSQAVLNAAIDKEHRTHTTLDSADKHRPRGYSITHGQVLGGFASLGLQTESTPALPAPVRQQPARTITKGSTDSSEAPDTPIEWRDSFGSFDTAPAAPTSSSPKWAHLAARPCNPLEPLDVLSIEEMGLHGLDIGSLNDWEGCKLSAQIMCPINGHQRIEWSIAQTTRRNKKWVVVPNATVTCGVTESFSAAQQAERTIVVSHRSLWLDEGEASSAPSQQAQSPSKPASGAKATSHRSSMPFSGKAGFELSLLRPTASRICPPVYLANASTHRYLYQHNREVDPESMRIHASELPDAAEEPFSTRVAPPSNYPVPRRSRSRPYMRKPQAQLRRSRSKPHLHTPTQRQAAKPAAAGVNPELFAPSLPGDPLLRTQPGESWPSARPRRSHSLSSFDSASGSDTSSDDGGFSATNTRESIMDTMSSASYDQPTGKLNECPRSAAIPMAAGGAHADRAALRSLSPGSSAASRGASSTLETSTGLAGWQPVSLEQQRARKHESDSTSYEVDSWLGTSPTTASASSLSASSKKSRSRKGFQKAMQKKDKMLSSWFKRKPENGSTPTSVSPVTENEKAQLSVPAVSAISAISAIGSSRKVSLAKEGANNAAPSGAITGAIPLTETALESFQRAIFRPISPESTIMGSRRGSEALTQRTAEPANNVMDRQAQLNAYGGTMRLNSDAAAQDCTDGFDNRSAVNSTLSQVYGWGDQQSAGRLLQPAASVATQTPMSLEDPDEENALLGLEAVPSGALTMLIPLPLIGRRGAGDTLAYMRVNFVPFGNSSGGSEAAPGAGQTGLQLGGSPDAESGSALPQSTSSGSNQLVERSSAAKSSEQSSWKRKLGLSSNRTGGGVGQSMGAPIGQASQGSQADPEVSQKSPQLMSNGFEPFRVTAIVLDAPWASRSTTGWDPRLPEPGTFPVVLGYCNDSKGLEMVPEGWGALRLAGVPLPTKPDGSPLDGMHPLHGVMDMIIAACTAVMDV